jgi:hypothetical protein
MFWATDLMNSAVLGADFDTGLNLRDEMLEVLWGDRPFAGDVARRNLQFFRNILDGSGQIVAFKLLRIYYLSRTYERGRIC